MWLDDIDVDDDKHYADFKWWKFMFQEWVNYIQRRSSLFAIEEAARVQDVYDKLRKCRFDIMDEQRRIRDIKHFKHVSDIPKFSKIAFRVKMYINWVTNDTLKSKLNWKLILR